MSKGLERLARNQKAERTPSALRRNLPLQPRRVIWFLIRPNCPKVVTCPKRLKSQVSAENKARRSGGLSRPASHPELSSLHWPWASFSVSAGWPSSLRLSCDASRRPAFLSAFSQSLPGCALTFVLSSARLWAEPSQLWARSFLPLCVARLCRVRWCLGTLARCPPELNPCHLRQLLREGPQCSRAAYHICYSSSWQIPKWSLYKNKTEVDLNKRF